MTNRKRTKGLQNKYKSLQKCMVMRYFKNNIKTIDPSLYEYSNSPNMEFKQFEIQLFHVTAIVLLVTEMYGTFLNVIDLRVLQDNYHMEFNIFTLPVSDIYPSNKIRLDVWPQTTCMVLKFNYLTPTPNVKVTVM